MINKKLCDLLEKYSVDMDFSSEIKLDNLCQALF